MRVLLYGATGWIGQMLAKLLVEHEVVASKIRLDNYAEIGTELDQVQPTHVLLCAGLTGRPNVDWCEDHKEEVVDVNVVGTSVLASECYRRKLHLTYMGTGCIFEFDNNHPCGDDSRGFTEADEPNFTKSWYSATKILTEKTLKAYSNVLILRIRMPLSDDLAERNFITKITKYSKVVNVPNSMSILADLLPIVPEMMLNKDTGIWNFTNPGTISHNQILDLYKKYIDPNFQYTNFSLDEQAKILKAGRSNNCLDTTKLTSKYHVPHIQDSIHDLFLRMKRNLIAK